MARPKISAKGNNQSQDKFAETGTIDKNSLIGIGVNNQQASNLFTNYNNRYGYLNGNPSQYLSRGTAKRSESGALGLTGLDDPTLYDWQDESFRLVWPLSTSIRLVVSQVLDRNTSFNIVGEETEQAKEFREKLQDWFEEHERSLIEKIIIGTMKNGINWQEMAWGTTENGLFAPVKFFEVHPGAFCFDWDSMEGFIPQRYGWSNGDGDKSLTKAKYVRAIRTGPYENPYGKSVVNELEAAVFTFVNTMLRLISAIDSNGIPIAVVKTRATMNKDSREQFAALRSAINSLPSNNAGLIFGSEVESFEFVDRKGKDAVDSHLETLEFTKREIIQTVYGSTLGTTDAQHGSRAQADTHMQTSDKYTKAVAQMVVDVVNSQILKYVLEWNWNDPKSSFVYDMDLNDPESIDVVNQKITLAATHDLKMPKRQAREWLDIQEAMDDEEFVEQPLVAQSATTPFEEDDPDSEPADPKEFATYSQLMAHVGGSKSRVKTLIRKAREAGHTVRKLGSMVHKGDFVAAIDAMTDGAEVLGNPEQLEDDEPVSDPETFAEPTKAKAEKELNKPLEVEPDIDGDQAAKDIQQQSLEVESISEDAAAKNETRARERLSNLIESATDDLQPSYSDQLKKALGKLEKKRGKAENVIKKFELDLDVPEDFVNADVAAALQGILTTKEITLTQVENAQFSEEFDEKEDRIDEAFQKFHGVVNMSASELDDWRETDASSKASINRGVVINRVIRLLEKRKKDWTIKDASDALKVYGFIERMRKAEQGEDISKDIKISKRDASLKNWGYNPRKSMAESVVRFAEASDFPSAFRPAVEWLKSRQVASQKDLEDMLEAVRAFGIDDEQARQIEQAIRDRLQVMKLVNSDTMAVKVQDWLAGQVATGTTINEAIRIAQDMIDAGEFPAVSRGYIQNIARTENAAASARQRQQIESTNPIIANRLWGWTYNAVVDNRTRPSHAAMDGEFIEKGSPEAAALGESPYSYQCRCSKTVVLASRRREKPEQSPDLMGKIRNLERFSEGKTVTIDFDYTEDYAEIPAKVEEIALAIEHENPGIDVETKMRMAWAAYKKGSSTD